MHHKMEKGHVFRITLTIEKDRNARNVLPPSQLIIFPLYKQIIWVATFFNIQDPTIFILKTKLPFEKTLLCCVLFRGYTDTSLTHTPL